MALTEKEKAERKRQRMIASSKKYQVNTYRNKVAGKFQRMIRAEHGAYMMPSVLAVVDGGIHRVRRNVGQVVCVTCGKVQEWSGGIGGMHTGHFIASRCNSILFEEDNVAPQCSRCNVYLGGEQGKFRKWMIAVRGIEVVERLERLKNTTRSFTHEELVDMRIEYEARTKAAIQQMGE